MLDTVVRDNLGSGVYFFANIGSLVLDHVRSEHNGGNGVSLTPSVGSIGAVATITDSVFTHNGGNGIGADAVPGATTTITVERSVVASNGGDGFVITESPGGTAVATMSRSAINDNGGNGISMGGGMEGTASDNVLKRNSGFGVLVSSGLAASKYVVLAGNVLVANLGGAISATGTGAAILLSANTVSVDSTGTDKVGCANSAFLGTYQNNAILPLSIAAGCSGYAFSLH